MAVKTIDDLDAAAPLDGTEPLETVQGGVSVRTNVGDVAAFIVPDAPLQEAAGRDLAETDNGKTLVYTAALDGVFVAVAGLPVGFRCTIVQAGAGQAQVDAGAGATVDNVAGEFKTGAQFADVTLINTDVDAYVLTGNTGA